VSPQKPRNAAGPVAGILAGVVAGGVFVLFWLAFGLPLIPSLLIGAVGYGAGLLVFRRSARSLDVTIPGVSREMIGTALREGGEKITELKSLSRRISSDSIRSKFDGVVAAAESILDDLKKNPKDIRAARQFLNYYLDATIKIVSRYADLSEKRLASADIQESLRKVESMLDTVKAAFEKQHARLLEDDVMDLDAEMSLLKQTIQMEGLGPEEKKE
jgi:5-bromo-4-chloroindolyl phosphate hydrolysis protein